MNNELEVDKINRLIQQSLPVEQKELVSDGYHTFKELYDHRATLFVALSNTRHSLDFDNGRIGTNEGCWKSMKHADGTMYDGWFIAGIGTEPGNTLTYHLPIDLWDSMDCHSIDTAPEWDGHTSEDVLRLLRNNF